MTQQATAIQLCLVAFWHDELTCPLLQSTPAMAKEAARRFRENPACGRFSAKLHHGAALVLSELQRAHEAFSALLNDPATGLKHDLAVSPVSDIGRTSPRLQEAVVRIALNSSEPSHANNAYLLLDAAHALFPKIGFDRTGRTNQQFPDPSDPRHLPVFPLAGQGSISDFLDTQAPANRLSRMGS